MKKDTKIFIKKFLIFSFIFLFFFILYFFFIPVKIYKKKRYEFDKFITISKINSNEKHNGYFFSKKECGYFNTESGMTYYKKVDDEENSILANKFFYIEYNINKNIVNVFSPSGQFISTINSTGYPYILNDIPVIFIVDLYGLNFKVFGMQGNILTQQINFTSLITSIHADKNYNLLVSTLEGKTYLFNIKRELLFDFKSKDSMITITKSNAIEYNGNLIAICTGLYPEYIEIFKKDSGAQIVKLKTKTNFKYESFLNFFMNRIFFESLEEINYYDLKDKKSGSIKIKGKLNEIVFGNKDKILIHCSKEGINYLMLYSLSGTLKFYKEFDKPLSDIDFVNNNDFYFKLEDQIIKVKETI